MGFNMFAEVRRAAEGTGARVWRRVEWRETTPGRRGLIASWTRAIAGGPVTRGALGGLATGGPGGAVVGAASAGVSTVQEQRAATARRRAAQAEVGEPVGSIQNSAYPLLQSVWSIILRAGINGVSDVVNVTSIFVETQ